jgi:hypothetical protein
MSNLKNYNEQLASKIRENSTRSGWFTPKKPENPLFLNFQIEFSRRIEKKIIYKVVSFCDTNKISPKNTSTFFEASYPFVAHSDVKGLRGSILDWSDYLYLIAASKGCGSLLGRSNYFPLHCGVEGPQWSLLRQVWLPLYHSGFERSLEPVFGQSGRLYLILAPKGT